MQRQLEDEVMHPGSPSPEVQEKGERITRIFERYTPRQGAGEKSSPPVLTSSWGARWGSRSRESGNPGPLRLGQGAANRVGGSQVMDSVRSSQ